MKNYFSSDFHLGHKNVIKYDPRPFADVEEMDETIINNCLKLFEKGDAFYYLGDWCLGSKEQAEKYMKKLADAGVNMFFIRGNHDKHLTRNLYQKYGTYLGEQKKVTINNVEIVLNHYRMDVWDKSHWGTWHLHGHSHHHLPERKESRCIDVGINGKEYGYAPIEFARVKEYMDKKEWKPIDNHRNK